MLNAQLTNFFMTTHSYFNLAFSFFQHSIIESYALSNGHTTVGESFDDNVSGMHFNRAGIEKIYEAVEAGVMDAIVVKDLSRLGRHRTQTALFIDFLRENHIRVLSATEGIDTFNENDDLIIGFKGLVNDFYARDGSRRVRTGYRQKQKTGMLLKANARSAPSNRPSHRYAGLLQCGDCGGVFIPMIRYWNGNRRVEYVCRSYHRGGKAICSSHRIHEETLDATVREYLDALRRRWTAEQADLLRLQRQWGVKRPAIAVHIAALHEEVQRLEQEIDDLMLEKIQSGG